MSRQKKNLVLMLAVAAAVASPSAFATNGYFSHGYGMHAKGMAGAATAMTSDSFGGANNPATMVFAGERVDVGIERFSPIRYASRTGASGAGMDATAKSESNWFLIPELGYNTMVDSKTSVGVTIYGNGGMNTNYPGGQLTGGVGSTCQGFGNTTPNPNMLCGNGSLGVNLEQLIVAPTLAYKITDSQSIGISPLLVYQRFRAYGLQGFAAFSVDSTRLTNNGDDTSTGLGWRLGWYGKLTEQLSFGAAYAPQTRMTHFEEYKGLFADYGNFDIPANWNVGLAFKAAPTTTLALDYQKIRYNDIISVGNSSRAHGPGNAGIPNSLGVEDGRGFGWQNMSIVKLGIEQQLGEKMVLRAGYSHGNNPIQAQDVTFNILAPGVIENHYTLGFSYLPSKNSELVVSYMHAEENQVTGASLYNDFGVPAGTETIRMYQNSLGVAWSQRW